MKLRLQFLKISLFLLLLTTCINAHTQGTWEFVHDGTTCSSPGETGSCMQARHEASYVQVGNKFYLLGGREHSSNVNIYDPIAESWTIGSDAPFPIHHFQAVEYKGLILIAGAMTGNFPNEDPIDRIIIYDPLNDTWLDGPSIPSDRLRGSAGVIISDDKLYLVCGIQNGHRSGWVPWLDEYDFKTNTWRTLPDAPHSRDHFHAAFVDNRIVVGGGRRSGESGTFNATEGAIDIFDLDSETWSTNPNDIPTHRAAPAVAVLGDEVLYIGGEKIAGAANNETEALNVKTGMWRSLTSLNEGRHGTQAIVNNENIWVASGSPKRGGGNTLTQERFYFTNPTIPNLSDVTSSTLNSEETIEVFNSTQLLSINNSGGNQAILVQGMLLSGSDKFTISTDIEFPFLLAPGNSFDIEVSHSGDTGQSAQIEIAYAGAESTYNISLNSGDEIVAPIGVNIAPDGTASQSSTRYSGSASLAIDRNTNGAYFSRSVTHTSNQLNAWWQVTWTDSYNIDQFSIYNRTDCCAGRLSDFTVEILDESNNVVFSQIFIDSPSPSIEVNTGGVVGNRLKVTLNGSNPLSLAEVEVIGTIIIGDKNIAPDGIASQSSTGYRGEPSYAIDRNTNGVYRGNSVTHTNNEEDAWWQVSWTENYSISKIKIYNRTDCCTHRLSNFVVSIVNQEGDTTYSEFFADTPDPLLTINAIGAVGDRVIIQLLDRNPLSLAEVEVYGTPLVTPSTVLTQAKSRSAKQTTSDVKQIKVYPNPAIQNIYIDVVDYQDIPLEIIILDQLGREHISKSVEADHDSIIELNISEMKSGYYMIVTKSEGLKTIVSKLVVSEN